MGLSRRRGAARGGDPAEDDELEARIRRLRRRCGHEQHCSDDEARCGYEHLFHDGQLHLGTEGGDVVAIGHKLHRLMARALYPSLEVAGAAVLPRPWNWVVA